MGGVFDVFVVKFFFSVVGESNFFFSLFIVFVNFLIRSFFEIFL